MDHLPNFDHALDLIDSLKIYTLFSILYSTLTVVVCVSDERCEDSQTIEVEEVEQSGL